MARQYALILGIIFLIIGILGFVPALTPNDRLFGLFMVNAAHNLIHIITGIIGIWASRAETPRAGAGFAWYLLIAYGIITVLGFILTPSSGMLFNLIMINAADNWLHLIVTLSALVVLFSEQRRPVFR